MMKIEIKRKFTKIITEVLKKHGKTIEDIRYISNLEHVKHWIDWKTFTSKEISTLDYNSSNFIIVGDNWWIDRTYEGASGSPCWNFRTMPKRPKWGYEQYKAYKRIYHKEA